MEFRNTKDIELLKLLLDTKRSVILEHTREAALTIAEIAERMGEKPSRLYYHVHKLEQAGLLKVVETKRIGNLEERYYRAVDDTIWMRPDSSMLSENSAWFMQRVKTAVADGLTALERKLAGAGRKISDGVIIEESAGGTAEQPIEAGDVHKVSQTGSVKLSLSFQQLQETEWKQHAKMIEAALMPRQLDAKSENDEEASQENVDTAEDRALEASRDLDGGNDGQKLKTYAYVFLTYEVDDSQ